MLQQALNRHSQIVVPPETKFFSFLLGHSKQCQSRHIARLRSDLGVVISEPDSAIRSVREARVFYEEIASRYLRRVGREHIVYFGEKTPEHAAKIPAILSLFPNAKIVFLIRDGRDVALSLTRMPWMSPDLHVCFLIWLYYFRILKRARNNACGNTYFAKYEEIVSDPEKELRRLLGFLELPYESAVAAGFGNSEGIPEREYPWKGLALEQITTSRVGVFRREISRADLGLMERLGGRALRSLGYELVTDGKARLSPAVLVKLAYSIGKYVLGVPRDLFTQQLLGFPLMCASSHRFGAEYREKLVGELEFPLTCSSARSFPRTRDFGTLPGVLASGPTEPCAMG
jgi:hypothetical protein